MANNEVVPAVPPMTEKDIKKLEEVTKNRFKLLTLQLRNRKKDMYDAAEEKLRELYAEEIGKAEVVKEQLNKEYQELEKNADELFRKGYELISDLNKEGIAIATLDYSGRRTGGTHQVLNPFVAQRHHAGKAGWGGELVPTKYKEKLKEAQTAINKLVREAEEKLELSKLEIMEKLAVGMLQTEDAKQYVEQIPGIMDLIPDNAMPQLTK